MICIGFTKGGQFDEPGHLVLPVPDSARRIVRRPTSGSRHRNAARRAGAAACWHSGLWYDFPSAPPDMTRREDIVMHSRKSLGIAVLAGLSISFTSAALAANPYKTPCRSDAKRICKMQNDVKAQSCLKQHLNEVTPACKAFLTKSK
jgi:hypothetical protein